MFCVTRNYYRITHVLQISAHEYKIHSIFFSEGIVTFLLLLLFENPVSRCIFSGIYIYTTRNNGRICVGWSRSQALSPLPSWWWCHPPLQNLRGIQDTCPKIRSFTESTLSHTRLQSVLGVRSYYVERNKFVYLLSLFIFSFVQSTSFIADTLRTPS